MIERISRYYNKRFMHAEFALSFVAACIGWIFGVVRYLPSSPVANASTIYTALIASFGALLGFAITGVSVILAFSDSGKLAPLRKSPYYVLVFDIFLSAARFLGFGFLSALLGLVVDIQTTFGQVIAYATLFALIGSLVRLSRCIWILGSIVNIVAGEAGEKPQDRR